MEVLRDVGVVADRDHHRRGPVLPRGRRPQLVEAFLPLPREGEQRGFRFAVGGLGLRLASRQPVPRLEALRHVFPQLEVHGVGTARAVDGREAGDLGDARFDGVHQAEVADDPGEGGALGIAASVEVEGRRRKVHAEPDPAGGVDPVQAAHPDRGLLAVRLLLGRQPRLPADRGGAVRMVSLVVQHHQRLVVPEVAEAGAGERLRRLVPQPADRDPAHRDDVGLRAQDVPVRDQHLALRQLGAQRGGHEVEPLVVAARSAGAQHAQALPDGQVRADHQHAAGIARVAGLRAAVAERPGDEHGHHHRLAGARRHLAGMARNGRRPGLVGHVGKLGMLRNLRHPFARPGIAPRFQHPELVR